MPPFQSNKNILSLTEDLLVRIYEILISESDRKSFRLACREFLRIDSLTRKHLRILRIEFLPVLLHKYPRLQSLDLSACPRIEDGVVSLLLSQVGPASNSLRFGTWTRGLKSLVLSRATGLRFSGLEMLARACPCLESVDVSYCCGFGDREAAALSFAVGLRELNMDKCLGLTDVGLAKIAVGCLKLEKLSLKWCMEITDLGVDLLCKKCVDLKYLDVSYLKVTDESLHSIASLLKLEVLGLMACPLIDDVGLQFIERGCPLLKAIDVSRCQGLSSSGLMFVVRGHGNLLELNAGYCLSELSTALLHQIKNLKHLEVIRIDGARIPESSFQVISANCKSLVEIGVSKCVGVTNMGLMRLVSGCINLRVLNLTCCHSITDAAISAIANSCRNLVCLKLESCNMITEKGLCQLGSFCLLLEEIDLTDCCGVNDKGLEYLSRCSELSCLKLGLCTNVSDKGLSYISSNCKKIHELDLYRCTGIGDDGLDALSSGCKELKKLNLSYCNEVSDRGLGYIGRLEELCDLEMRALNKITGVGLESVAAGCKRLADLDLKHCEKVDDLGFWALAYYSRNLRQINLSYCAISDMALCLVMGNLTRLQEAKLVHLCNVTVEGFELALRACCLFSYFFPLPLPLSIPPRFSTLNPFASSPSHVDFCKSVLPSNKFVTILDFGRVLVYQSLSNAHGILGSIKYFLRLHSTSYLGTTRALQDCQFLAEVNVDFLSHTLEQIKSDRLNTFLAADLHCLLSVVLTNVQTCVEGLEAIPSASSCKHGLLPSISNGTNFLRIDIFRIMSINDPEQQKRSVIITLCAIMLVSMVIVVVFSVSISRSDGSDDGNDEMKTGDKNVHTAPSMKAIRSICQLTDFKRTCVEEVKAESSNTTDVKELVQAALKATIKYLRRASRNSTTLRNLQKDLRSKRALDICKQLTRYSIYELRKSFNKINEFGSATMDKMLADLKIWLSATITNQRTCLDGFKNTTTNARQKMKKAMTISMELSRDGLAIISELADFQGGVSRRLLSNDKVTITGRRSNSDFGTALENVFSRRLLQVDKANVVVAKDGSGSFKTIKGAMSSIPHNSPKPFVIYIKEGIYRENIEFGYRMKNLVLIGDGKEKTRITGRRNNADGIPTFRTATVAVNGDKFFAKNIGFENTAGAAKLQAVALMVISDFAVFYNCSMDGYQRTLYVHSKRQFYRNCIVSGTIDFVFGDAAAVFQNCTFLVRKPLDGQKAVVTSQARSDIREPTAIVIHNSSFMAAPEMVHVRHKYPTYLGRPSGKFARTIIVESYLDDLIKPEGWTTWGGTWGINTCFYSEFNNHGPGSSTTARVQWPGIKEITTETARKFTPKAFFDGVDSWITTRGVPYTPGFLTITK
ncbi:hypothetical protein V6N11_079426 [Hibiscus sabdariffa]|uniref:Pectinesterase inhibitor domain-containing protein n=1 Tax=Hibiscus sabdariffa TaxID=183260 RepID=A0ABR2RVN9_9ROSI